jgi:hypothetical protein
MSLTTDPNDPRLGRQGERGLNDAYLVLSEEERGKGFARPLRRAYVHVGVGGTEQSRTGGGCGAETRMALALCETYARDPGFYGATYCIGCRTHLPVGEFVWDEDGQVVGS